MDKNLIAAVIGYHRCGATIEEIIGATGLDAETIKFIIKKHLPCT